MRREACPFRSRREAKFFCISKLITYLYLYLQITYILLTTTHICHLLLHTYSISNAVIRCSTGYQQRCCHVSCAASCQSPVPVAPRHPPSSLIAHRYPHPQRPAPSAPLSPLALPGTPASRPAPRGRAPRAESREHHGKGEVQLKPKSVISSCKRACERTA
jgi:hypothetical protein